jgi:hypothetical protein
MGEQFIDLFTAGAYALCGRVFSALAAPAFSWLFYLLATIGIVFALIESAVEQRPDLWLRHLVAVCMASVLTMVPQAIDLRDLGYSAPGQVEQLFGTRVGAAPQITYWIERLGATAATSLRSLIHSQPALTVPGVAQQVSDIASDPASLNDPQIKANLEIWRRRLVPQILRDHPDLASQLRAADLSEALLNPAPAEPQFVGTRAAEQAQAVRSALAAASIDLAASLQTQSPLVNQIAQDAGATPWDLGSDPGATPAIRFVQRTPPTSARPLITAAAFDDALQHGSALATQMRAQLPQADQVVAISGADQLYDNLGRSILYGAGVTIARDRAAQATIGSLCQRAGDAVCRGAMAPLIEASTHLRVSDADRYNRYDMTTILQQPITTLLLTITAVLMETLSSLVVSVLPFALGIAKAMAIVVSMIGAWLLLWPGRARVALSWMFGPISFVSLWSVLFNLWADIEPGLAQIAELVGGTDHGSWSAVRAMSIAIALGYLGLPSLALGIIYGESGRALYHASARLETALLMAWHTRGSIAAFARRWLVNSPMARRWNQRAYRAIGLGALRPARGSASTPRAPSARSSKAGRAPRAGTRLPPPPPEPGPGSDPAPPAPRKPRRPKPPPDP